ncbi:hypothetical protein RE628_25415 [Paenibacillus sp. D2_2]|uniref:hypothetical protein n=1 Tax=Paenibacillus sp. D2_2 TaxID=3073092 RepID=UPI002814AA33|nr:hypothetical protein [Paenibacillus sp. D2_2]WMT40490.1 hypothetical protein RE628_25415 [Paenibacillus sp. D2_2]
MDNGLVRYSRAGDVFHYRWAARRCLKMIYPKSKLSHIMIEGSEDLELDGEYVIDVAEYWGEEETEIREIAYFQLKHTTVRYDQPFNLSDLKDTIKGFAKRYVGHLSNENKSSNSPKIKFYIVTNRPIAESFKNNLKAVGSGRDVGRIFKETIEEYSALSQEDLKEFCSLIELVDGEGNYNQQKYELYVEVSQLVAGSIDNQLLENITALVQEKALPDPNGNGKIVKEDIYMRLGISSEREMYPAPPELEKIDKVIPRIQYIELLDQIIKTPVPKIIHAAGGVGKSVFARYMVQNLPIGSLGLVYDCFGGGRYRNRSESRHRHRDGLIQIVNELASHGLCDPILAISTALEDDIIRKFISRIAMAISALKETNNDAVLAIVIDAADNAEMAAEEFNQDCFVHELLRESIPAGCQLIALCRTERIHLLQPSSSIIQLELKPFSEKETMIHLRNYYSEAKLIDGIEFHRLTSGNPRVQANSLSAGFSDIIEVLTNLGPSGTTVEDQIKAQLNFAVSGVKDKLSSNYQKQIDSICVGLATLPPFIPISILSKAAEVEESTLKSFIADLGRPLWISNTSVHFRDEPTETWFREQFRATPEQVLSYLERLKSLASSYIYVALTLPSLLLQAGQYRELIELAVSDEFLPENNPIDERNVRVYRLQFAFKAALKQKQYADAIKIALRGGEEVAGNKRQYELLSKNVDLIAPLQDKERVQELAFRQLLKGEWDGSENVYSASLLSFLEDFRGEARGYLRSSNNWLKIYFEKQKEEEVSIVKHLKNEDIVEMVYAYFNLNGIKFAIDFILSWKPIEIIYSITRRFARRLVDAGNFEALHEMLSFDSRSQYLTIAVVQELLEVGQVPDSKALNSILILFTTN